MTDTNEGGWGREREIGCIYKHIAHSNVMDWHAGVCFTLTPTLWLACAEPGTCDVHLPPIAYLKLNTSNFLHVNTIFT
jgi:hypothetical protein